LASQRTPRILDRTIRSRLRAPSLRISAGHPGKTSRDITLSIISPLFLSSVLPPLSHSRSFSFLHSLLSSVAVFSVSRLPELFQSPTWEDLSNTPTFRDHRLRPAGITGEKEVSRKKKESLRKTVRGPAWGQDSISGIYERVAHACDSQRDVGFTVISSYFMLSRLHLFLCCERGAPTDKRFHSSNIYFLSREVSLQGHR